MKKSKRFKVGSKNLYKIDGAGGKAVIDSLASSGEDIGKYIIEFAFGDVYNRKKLSLKQKEMITITSLLSQGDTKHQLYVHINGSLNVGISKKEIIETFIQCIPYVGFPKVLNAVSTAKKVFNERKSKK